MKHRSNGVVEMPELRLTPALCARIRRRVRDPGPASGFSYLSDEEYRASIDETLARAPDPAEIWIFAYGSLIWKPGFEPVERRIGVVKGWHRSFCLKTTRWRGVPECPGLMMALERGGECRGVAYRLPPNMISECLHMLWRREIGVKPINHHPRWVSMDTDRKRIRALAFTANPAGQSYVGKIPLEETAAIIARAVGVWGSCAEYLCETVSHLEAMGIRDGNLWRLQALVAEHILRGEGYLRRRPPMRPSCEP
jgi:glutathione-specific gamma-glutamylcyclotransferase